MAGLADWRMLSLTPPSKRPHWTASPLEPTELGKALLNTPPTPSAAHWRPSLPPLHLILVMGRGRGVESSGGRFWLAAGDRPLHSAGQVTLARSGPSSWCQHPARLFPTPRAQWRKGLPRTRKLSPLPWAMHRLYTSLVPPGPGPSWSMDCPPAALCPLRDLAEMPMLEPHQC